MRFFFIKDRITVEELELQYCPTDQMIGDYFSKPLQGKKFFFFGKIIMGEEDVSVFEGVCWSRGYFRCTTGKNILLYTSEASYLKINSVQFLSGVDIRTDTVHQ